MIFLVINSRDKEGKAAGVIRMNTVIPGDPKFVIPKWDCTIIGEIAMLAEMTVEGQIVHDLSNMDIPSVASIRVVDSILGGADAGKARVAYTM